MTTQIPSQYILQYEDEMRLAYQFEGNKLRGKVRESVHIGQGASPADYVGPMLANENPSRLATTPNNSATVTRRWVYPTYIDSGVAIAQQDLTRVFNGGQLQAGYAEAQGKAMARKVDDIILAAFFAASVTGQNGGSTTAVPSGNIIADNFDSAAATGLTVAKLIEGKRILQSGGVDIERAKLYCVITSTDHAFLLKQIEIRSREYNEKYELVEGYLMRYLGIEFVHIDFQNAAYYPDAAAAMNPSGSGTDRYIPLWADDAMYLGEWKPITLRASERPDLSYAWQMYTFAEIGATRLQEAGVVQINCL